MGIIILIISPANSLTMLVFTVRKPSDGMVSVLNLEQKPPTNTDFVPNAAPPKTGSETAGLDKKASIAIKSGRGHS